MNKKPADNLQMKLMVSSEAARSTPGDLGTIVKDGELLIHPETIERLEANGLNLRRRSVIEFLTYAQVYPTFFAQALGYSSPSLAVQAYEKLAVQLRGILPDEVLNYEPVDRSFGALNPDPLNQNKAKN